MSRHRRRSGAAIAGAAVAMLASGARAETLAYGVDAGIGETDNVTLAPDHKTSQTLAVVDADFKLDEQTRLLDLAAKGNFSYLDFLQGAYNDQFIGRFDGSGQYAFIPERLSWTLQDDFGQAQLDPFAPQVPTNQENINYVSTGPNLSLRLGSTGFVDLSARAARTDYETSPFTNDRLQGSAAFGIPLSSQSSVSLDANVERVLFDNTLVNTDFNRSSGFAHYDLHGARTDVMLNAGVTRVTQEGQTFSGPLVKLELTRKLSASAQVSLQAGREITDGSLSFSAQQAGALGTVGTAPAAISQVSGNYTANYASLAWQYHRERTSVSLSGRWEKDSYDHFSQFDQRRGNAEARIDRRLTRRLSGGLYAAVASTHYQETSFGSQQVFAGGSLALTYGRALEFRLRLEHDSYSADGLGAGTGYKENRVFLTVGYRPRKADAPAGEPGDTGRPRGRSQINQ